MRENRYHKNSSIPTKNNLVVSTNKNTYYDKEECKLKPISDDSLAEDSFESGPSHDEEEENEEESPDDEYNTNIGYDRRHDDELY